MVHAGKSATAGGEALGISPRTFENHRALVYAKTGAKDKTELIRMVEQWQSLKLREKGGEK